MNEINYDSKVVVCIVSRFAFLLFLYCIYFYYYIYPTTSSSVASSLTTTSNSKSNNKFNPTINNYTINSNEYALEFY